MTSRTHPRPMIPLSLEKVVCRGRGIWDEGFMHAVGATQTKVLPSRVEVDLVQWRCARADGHAFVASLLVYNCW